MSKNEISDICSPISSLIDVQTWNCNGNCWIHKYDVVDINSTSIKRNTGYVLDQRNRNDVFSEYKLSSDSLPRTIFCHDYKGGYLEDKFCNGDPNINTYRFFNWAGIDLFIYFSHHLVTIPTRGWLNAGHTHGVPVLGTLITEWKEGERIWRNVLTDVERTSEFARKLAEVCSHFKFDGYLVNVENEIPEAFVPRLVQFLQLLKAEVALRCGSRRTWVIWYDSVTTAGALDWQNKLCPLNKPFFDACDGIFLNYVWTPADLLESKAQAGARLHDVYVGLDVWGRNNYQDGGFNIDKALAVVRSLGMSVAIFAPAWTFEAISEGEDFLRRETRFWRQFWPYLHVHGPAYLPFHTNFCQGITLNKATGTPWFNLVSQSYQPTAQCCLAEGAGCISLCQRDGAHNGTCLLIKASDPQHATMFHRVFVCDFTVETDAKYSLLVTFELMSPVTDPASSFRVYFVFEDRISIEGKKIVSMKRRPRGYRATAVVPAEGGGGGQLLVAGSVIDFTAALDPAEPRIVVSRCTTDKPEPWHEVTFELLLGAGVAVTEILLRPAVTGSVLWRLLDVSCKP